MQGTLWDFLIQTDKLVMANQGSHATALLALPSDEMLADVNSTLFTIPATSITETNVKAILKHLTIKSRMLVEEAPCGKEG